MGFFGSILKKLGLKKSKGEKITKQAAQLQLGALQAVLDPSQEQFTQLSDFLEQDALRDFEEGVRQVEIRDRRARARGGGIILNPERRDESIFNALARSRETAGAQARANAFDILLGRGDQTAQTAGQLADLELGTGGRALNTLGFGLGVPAAIRDGGSFADILRNLGGNPTVS